MQDWNELSTDATKTAPDTQKAKALLQMAALREKSLKTMKTGEFSTLIAETYYEILKELMTALLSIEGWKTTSHELLIGYLAKYHKEYTQPELHAIDQLRRIRNDIAYRGIQIKPDYLERNEQTLLKLIEKLKKTIHTRIAYPTKH
jgi:hypothetical protein